jgi:hypothetical protein
MICSDWSLFQCVSILAVRMVKIAQVSERSPLDGAARQKWSRLAAQTLKVKATSLSWSPALRGLLSKPRGGGGRTGVRESPNKICATHGATRLPKIFANATSRRDICPGRSSSPRSKVRSEFGLKSECPGFGPSSEFNFRPILRPTFYPTQPRTHFACFCNVGDRTVPVSLWAGVDHGKP